MIYDEIILNSKYKATVCPICENEHTEVEGDYCQICGTQILNKCTSCESRLSGEDRYCSFCGSPSTYLRDNLLKDWKSIRDELSSKELFVEESKLNTLEKDFKPNYYLVKDE